MFAQLTGKRMVNLPKRANEPNTYLHGRVCLDGARASPYLETNVNVRVSREPQRLPIVADSAPVAGPRELMQVGDLAKESGKTVRAIHLYEELALLHPAGRSKGRYRLYGPDALVRIRWISKLQELGFSLPELQGVLRDTPSDTAHLATERLQSLYSQKLAETRQQIKRLHALELELKESLAYLSTCGDVCEPERLMTQCRSCDLHEQHAQHKQLPHAEACAHAHSATPQNVPELVLGFRVQSLAGAQIRTQIRTQVSTRTLPDPHPSRDD
jgi:MerR family transcriptional regulator, copper efflux regulator